MQNASNQMRGHSWLKKGLCNWFRDTSQISSYLSPVCLLVFSVFLYFLLSSSCWRTKKYVLWIKTKKTQTPLLSIWIIAKKKHSFHQCERNSINKKHKYICLFGWLFCFHVFTILFSFFAIICVHVFHSFSALFS